MSMFRILGLVLASVLLAGCSALPFGGERVTVHDLRIIARSTSPDIPASIGISREEARRWVAIEQRIEQVAGVRVDAFYLADAPEINARAALRDGKRLLFINRPFVERLGQDEAAIASLLGHEIAHLALEHPSVQAGVQPNLDHGVRALGVVANVALPGSGAFVSLGGQVISLAHSRNHEQEADRLGLDYAVRAGFEPSGALRVFGVLPENAGGGGGLFDSHPANAERIALLRALIKTRYTPQPLGSTPAANAAAPS